MGYKILKKLLNVFAGLILLVVFIGCSGSGSGDASQVTVFLNPLEITAINAVQVFQEGFISLELVVEILTALIDEYDSTPPAVGPVTIMCSAGTNTVTFNDTDINGIISSGDTIIDTDSACTESGVESNGTIVIILDSLTDSANGRYQGSFEFQNVVLADNTEALGLSGTILFDITINGPSIILNTLMADEITLGAGTQANAFQTETKIEVNALTKSDTSLALDVDFESEFLNGKFSMISIMPLVFNALEYPTAGVLRVVGGDTNADFSGSTFSNPIASVVIREQGGATIGVVVPSPSWNSLTISTLINLP